MALEATQEGGSFWRGWDGLRGNVRYMQTVDVEWIRTNGGPSDTAGFPALRSAKRGLPSLSLAFPYCW